MMRREMNEMEMDQVVGGVFMISDLLFKKDQKVNMEEAIMNSRKKVPVVTLEGRKNRDSFVAERRTVKDTVGIC